MNKLLIAIFLTLISASVIAEPAMVIRGDGNCTLFDGDGNVVVGNNFHFVSTNNGQGIRVFQCRAKRLANTEREAVQYDTDNNPLFSGLLCVVNGEITSDWHENVSASGNATLTCKLRD